MLGLSVSGPHPDKVGGGITPSIVVTCAIRDIQSGAVQLKKTSYILAKFSVRIRGRAAAWEEGGKNILWQEHEFPLTLPPNRARLHVLAGIQCQRSGWTSRSW